jgi:hypothetical protein
VKEVAERSAKSAAADATKEGAAGELSKAGRSLAKHSKGKRPGAKGFPEATGNPKAINKQASEVLDGIMNDPAKTVKLRPGKGDEQIMQVNRPDGTSAIFKLKDGNWVFSHFAENLY